MRSSILEHAKTIFIYFITVTMTKSTVRLVDFQGSLLREHIRIERKRNHMPLSLHSFLFIKPTVLIALVYSTKLRLNPFPFDHLALNAFHWRVWEIANAMQLVITLSSTNNRRIIAVVNAYSKFNQFPLRLLETVNSQQPPVAQISHSPLSRGMIHKQTS